MQCLVLSVQNRMPVRERSLLAMMLYVSFGVLAIIQQSHADKTIHITTHNLSYESLAGPCACFNTAFSCTAARARVRARMY